LPYGPASASSGHVFDYISASTIGNGGTRPSAI
jgi:hypothetical protein